MEGNSIRGTVRMTGTAKNTVTKLLLDVGEAASAYMDATLVDLPCNRLQVDEIWSYVYAKAKNVPPEKMGEAGDVWTWVALDADTKLVPSFLVGGHGPMEAHQFMTDVAGRMANRVQLSSDGNRLYLTAVERAFGSDIDYAMIVKIYQSNPSGYYSPPECIGTETYWVMGKPDWDQVSTSYAERQNLTMRMNIRRLTRLTNGFSKKIENHVHAMALYFQYYNFCRKHETLTKAAKGVHTTPAMAAGVANHVWKLEEVVALLEAQEAGRA
ncbi:MAG: IS1 family transposase [Acidimicrobiia bacterium]